MTTHFRLSNLGTLHAVTSVTSFSDNQCTIHNCIYKLPTKYTLCTFICDFPSDFKSKIANFCRIMTMVVGVCSHILEYAVFSVFLHNNMKHIYANILRGIGHFIFHPHPLLRTSVPPPPPKKFLQKVNFILWS
jgi:hypothetical protein